MYSSILNRGRDVVAGISLAGWQGVVIFGVLLPLILSLEKFKDVIFVSVPWMQFLIPSLHAIVVLSVIAFFIAGKRVPGVAGLLVLGALFFLSRLTFYFLVDQQLYSDFARMWQVALRANENGLDLSTITSGREIRALTFLYPIVAIHGDNPIWYQVYNALYLTGSFYLTYFLGVRLWNKKVALVAVSMLFLSGELLFSGEVDTHDIPGTFIFLLSLFILIKVHDLVLRVRGANEWSEVLLAAFLALSLGVLYVLLDFLRGLTLFLTAAVLFYLLCLFTTQLRAGYRLSFSRLVLLCFLMVFIPFGTSVTIQKTIASYLHPRAPAVAQRLKLEWIAGHAHVEGRGRFPDYQKLYFTMRSIPDVELPGFAYGLYLANVLDAPVEKVWQIQRKMRELYFIGSQTTFYVGRLQPNSFEDDPRVLQLIKRRIFGWNSVINGIFALLLTLSLLYYVLFRFRKVRIQHLPLIAIAVVALALLAFGEVQPRFVYPIWFIGALYIGQVLTFMRRRVVCYRSGTAKQFIEFSAYFVSFVVIAGMAIMFVNQKWTLADGRILNLKSVTNSIRRATSSNRYVFEMTAEGGKVELDLSDEKLPKTLKGVLVLKGFAIRETCPVTVRIRDGKSLVSKETYEFTPAEPVWISFPRSENSSSLTLRFSPKCPEQGDALKLMFGYMRKG